MTDNNDFEYIEEVSEDISIEESDTSDTEEVKNIIEESKEEIQNNYISSMQVDSIENTIEVLNELANIYGPKLFNKRKDTPGTDVHILVKRISEIGAQDTFIRKSLDRVSEDALLDTKYINDKYKFADVSRASNKNYNGANLSGEEALMIINAKAGSVKKIWLYNSGINIILRGPTLNELNTTYNRIKSNLDEYGAELGPNFYLFNDYLIKDAILDLIFDLIIDTNLEGWSRDRKIFDHLTLHCYDSILHTIGRIMYKDKYPYAFTCTNKKEDKTLCKHSQIYEIDLSKIRINNYSLIPDTCFELLNKSGKLPESHFEEYREKLNLSRELYLYDQYKAVTKVPVISEYMAFGRVFNNKIIEAVYLDDQKKITEHIAYNYYKIFTPWIDKINYYNEDGTISFYINDSANMATILDIAQLEQSNFGEDIENFIADSSVSHIAIPFAGCPSCNYIPTYCKNGYITFDVQSNFFSQSVMRLALNI